MAHPASSSFPLGKREEKRAGHAVQRPSVPGVSKPDSAAALGSTPAVTTTKLKAKCRVWGGKVLLSSSSHNVLQAKPRDRVATQLVPVVNNTEDQELGG